MSALIEKRGEKTVLNKPRTQLVRKQVPKEIAKGTENQHRNSKKNDADIVHCIESDETLHYEVGRDPERFNFYYLGVMEDYEMDDEHFEALAKRKREDE
ncbi:hypothetical protein ACEPAH_7888 [Sanghuangporus vaninii]